MARRTKHEQAGRHPHRTSDDLGFGCTAPPAGRRSYPCGAGLWGGGAFHFRRRSISDDNGHVLWDEPKPWDHTMAVGCGDKRDSDLAVSDCTFAATDASRFTLDGKPAAQGLWGDPCDNKLCNHRVCSTSVDVRVLDPKWHHLVGSRRGSTLCNHLRLCDGLVDADQGEFRCRCRGAVGCTGVDVALAEHKAAVPGDADNRTVFRDPPAHLCGFRAHALDSARLDARSAGFGTRAHDLLPRRAQTQGTQVRETLWRPLSRLSAHGALCRPIVCQKRHSWLKQSAIIWISMTSSQGSGGRITSGGSAH